MQKLKPTKSSTKHSNKLHSSNNSHSINGDTKSFSLEEILSELSLKTESLVDDNSENTFSTSDSSESDDS